MKEAAVQRRHNLYRDSIVLTNSDPNLHLLSENPPIDWAGEFGAKEEMDGEGATQEPEDGDPDDPEVQKRRRMKQVVSMIQVDPTPDTCLELPAVEDIPEEGEEEVEQEGEDEASASPTVIPKVPNGTSSSTSPSLTNGNDLKVEVTTDKQSPAPVQEPSQEGVVKLAPEGPTADPAVASAIQEIENAVLGEDGEQSTAPSTQTEATAATTHPPKPESEAPAMKEEEAVSKDQEQCVTEAAVVAAVAASPNTVDEGKPLEQEDVVAPSQQQVEVESTSEPPAESDQPTGGSSAGQSDSSSSIQSPATEATEKQEEPQLVQVQEKHSDSVAGEEDSGKTEPSDPVVANEM